MTSVTMIDSRKKFDGKVSEEEAAAISGVDLFRHTMAREGVTAYVITFLTPDGKVGTLYRNITPDAKRPLSEAMIELGVVWNSQSAAREADVFAEMIDNDPVLNVYDNPEGVA